MAYSSLDAGYHDSSIAGISPPRTTRCRTLSGQNNHCECSLPTNARVAESAVCSILIVRWTLASPKYEAAVKERRRRVRDAGRLFVITTSRMSGTRQSVTWSGCEYNQRYREKRDLRFHSWSVRAANHSEFGRSDGERESICAIG